jgi:hypothetical protein
MPNAAPVLRTCTSSKRSGTSGIDSWREMCVETSHFVHASSARTVREMMR